MMVKYLAISAVGLISLFIAMASASVAISSNFDKDFFVTWSPSKVNILSDGQTLQLSLDNTSGSGFASKNSYMYGNIDMQIKLVPGNSAGTVTAYYLSGEGANRDELDFEFLGNETGEPYIVQTNVYTNGVGGREQRVYLWFDPTANFHTYSLSWNKQRIIFLVDGTPIRVYANNEALGVPYLDKQPMQVYSSLWNGDDWATRGGLVKIDWRNAPFVASYRNFRANACLVPKGDNPNNCIAQGGVNANSNVADNAHLNARLRWVQRNFLIYDYCNDHARYNTTPTECAHNNL